MSEEAAKTYRPRVIKMLKLLSSAKEQLDYEKNVPFVSVPTELFCMWFDDLDIKSSLQESMTNFSQREVNFLKKFTDFLDLVGNREPISKGLSLEELLKTEDWQNVMKLAGEIHDILSQGN